MPSNNQFGEALKKEGGCGLLIYAIGAVMVGVFIYSMIYGFGDPEIKKVQDSCWDRETFRLERQIGELSDSDRRHIVQQCDAEVKAYLDSKRDR